MLIDDDVASRNERGRWKENVKIENCFLKYYKLLVIKSKKSVATVLVISPDW